MSRCQTVRASGDVVVAAADDDDDDDDEGVAIVMSVALSLDIQFSPSAILLLPLLIGVFSTMGEFSFFFPPSSFASLSLPTLFSSLMSLLEDEAMGVLFPLDDEFEFELVVNITS